jgi:pyruvate formate lyase activating enzyme
MKKEAILYRRLQDNRVECTACARLCKIPEGSRGFCFVRQNVGGKLYLANYGTLAAMQLDPIEKKPFNHFMPGSYVFGIGTSSCNWGCEFCQNHNISKEKEITGMEFEPKNIVELAIKNKAQGIAYTYNEPAIFIEYALDVARIARKKKLYNVFVTNGYVTTEAVQAMKGLIDAVVVNFKGNGEQKFANKYEVVMSNEPIKEAMLEMKKAGMHIEMTDLIIPSVGESIMACDSLMKWVRENLGADIPIQFIRFHPDYKMLDYPETPYETLKKHYEIAKNNGLQYVYIGNVPGNPYESTYCPGCGHVAIGRVGYSITKWDMNEKRECKRCGHEIFMVGNRPKKFRHREISVLY